MAKQYKCLQAFEWVIPSTGKPVQYMAGLLYTGYDDEAHKAFREMAPKWVAEGKFELLPGEAGASVAGIAITGKAP